MRHLRTYKLLHSKTFNSKLIVTKDSVPWTLKPTYSVVVDNVGGGVRSVGRGGRRPGPGVRQGSDTGYRSPPLVLICCIARPANPIPLTLAAFQITSFLSHVSSTYVSMCVCVCYVLTYVCVGVRVRIFVTPNYGDR